MADLRSFLSDLDRIERPDLWPEVERRAAADPITTIRGTTRWAPTSAQPSRRTAAMLSAPRILAVTAAAALTTGLLAVTLQTASPDLASVPASGSAAPGSPAPGAAIVWDSGSVRLEANALEIKAGDKVFSGQAPYAVHSDPGDPTYRTLEVEWVEDGLEQRLYLYFGADELDWWITEVRTRDGYPDADWITYDVDLLAATPRGETYEGDIHLVGGDGRVPGELTIRGARLTAFAPGSGPGALSDCERVRASVRVGAESPLDEGQPLAGSGIEEMSPQAAEALLREAGLCFTFRYQYPTSEDRSEGYSERWCTAPPGGTIRDEGLAYLDDGEVVVFVSDDRVMPVREQPPEGWDCPAG